MASGDIDVAYVAKLPRLALEPAEIERFGAQLGALLEYVKALEALPVADVAATAQVIPSTNVMRDDVAEPLLPARRRAGRRAAAGRGVFPRAPHHRGGGLMAAPSARELARAVNVRERSAGELAEEALARVAERDGAVGAFLWSSPENVREHARRVDARVAAGESLPLAGVPLAVKDNMCLSGTPTTCASKILAGWVAPYTATAVQRLLDGGAVPLGKTNLDEFAMGSPPQRARRPATRGTWGASPAAQSS